jgi:anti-sigma factor RsiW
MKIEITRQVILDLLPIYLANEASADTRTLVEQYLETDPELAKLAEETKMTEFIKDIPIPLTEKDKLEAFKEARRLELLRTVFVVVAICSMLLAGGALLVMARVLVR